MKKRILSITTIVFAAALVFTSCTNDDSADLNEPISSKEVAAVVVLDNASAQINNLLDDYFVAEGIAARSSQQAKSTQSCWSKKVVLDLKNQIVTLDFGSGCQLSSGDVIKGSIILTYALDISSQSFVVTYTYKDFYFNKLMVEGTNELTVVRENSNGKPQSTLKVDEKITWESGDFANRKGTKIREFSDGFDTRTYSDNVFLITGNWTDTFNNGTVIKGTVTESLRREMTCENFVSGKLKLERNEIYGVLDFGDGTCDNKAIFILSDGTEIEIVL